MEQEQTTTGTEILIKAAGPIVIASKCIVTKADGTIDIKEKASFCGCGHSANKPYCDGSHKKYMEATPAS
jgi:CDGSH-type Zn-finger protein